MPEKKYELFLNTITNFYSSEVTFGSIVIVFSLNHISTGGLL